MTAARKQEPGRVNRKAAQDAVPEPLYLVSDIGGTRIRLALADSAGGLHRIQEFKTNDFADFCSCAKTYLKDQLDDRKALQGAGLAIAGPVEQGLARMTNCDWVFDSAAIGKELGLAHLFLANDFEAQAHALPWLDPQVLEQIGQGSSRSEGNRVILGPGTGLGVAGLIAGEGGRHRAAVGEGGHTTLAAANDGEAALIACLRRRFGHVSAERVLSGPGLEALYLAILQERGEKSDIVPLPAREIAASATAGNLAAQAALHQFSAFLGTVAADFALIFWARGGVFLSGGVVKRLGPAFDRGAFRDRFESKGRFSTALAGMPTFLITQRHLGLLGLAKMAMQSGGATGDRPAT